MFTYKNTLSLVAAFLAVSTQVNAHGFITDIVGANGKKVQGFGVNLANVIPGNQGSTSTGFNNEAPCGRGVAAGQINIAGEIEKAIKSGLPTVGANGEVSMNWQQVNGGSDGGGPGNAVIDVTGTGKNFVPLQISKDFGDGGSNSRNPMTVRLPAGTKCTGGSSKNACLIRVINGPGFGSCLAVESPSGGGGGAAPAPAPAPPPPAPAKGCGTTHTVKPGDTCDAIARSQGVELRTMLSLNKDINAGCTNLKVGQQVCVAGQKKRNYARFSNSMNAKRAWLKMTLAGL